MINESGHHSTYSSLVLLFHCVDFSKSFDIQCELTNRKWAIVTSNLITCNLTIGGNRLKQFPETLSVNDQAVVVKNGVKAVKAVQIVSKKEVFFVGLGSVFSDLRIYKANEKQESTVWNFIFKGLTSLEVIYLRKKGIEKIEEGAFVDQRKSLKALFLEGNLLSTIGASTLHGLFALQKISLQRNPFHCISSDSFETDTNLQVILDIRSLNCLGKQFTKGNLSELEVTRKKLEICEMKQNEPESYIEEEMSKKCNQSELEGNSGMQNKSLQDDRYCRCQQESPHEQTSLTDILTRFSNMLLQQSTVVYIILALVYLVTDLSLALFYILYIY